MEKLSEMCPCDVPCPAERREYCTYGCDDYIDWSGATREKLAAYEDAEEQGLLVRLPCKRGDKVWRICGPRNRKFVAERTVLSVTMYEPGAFEIYTNCFDWLGKTVFLTREEAEQALERRRTDDKR